MPERHAADRLAARATGVGIGLVALMVVWTVGARITERIWEPPAGPWVAWIAALLVGAVTSAVSARRLGRTVETEPEADAPER